LGLIVPHTPEVWGIELLFYHFFFAHPKEGEREREGERVISRECVSEFKRVRACVERGKEREGGEKGKAYIGRGEGRG
jgi:hypothetical protein